MTATRGQGAEEDASLVTRVAEGEAAALEALYHRYGRVAYSLARRILGDEQLAQDVVQEVFLTIWRDAIKFDSTRGQVSTWLLTMTHHKSVDSVRKEENLRKRREPADVLEFQDAGVNVDEDVWTGIKRERVRAALGRLPEVQRQAIGLAYFGGYTQREIAKLTDTPLGTVKTRMLAGMRRMRDGLETSLDSIDRTREGRA
ncbi:MAG: sigma-70 family RNA polymerase sigma factor [Actinomycetota bacterium]